MVRPVSRRRARPSSGAGRSRGSRHAPQIAVSLLVRPARRRRLRRPVSRADVRVLLVQPDPLGPVHREFIGLENFRQFFSEPFLLQGLVNTLIYAVVTSGTKTVIGLLLAVLLTSGIFAQGFLRTVIFFPVLVSFIGVGFTFTALMHPTRGAINVALAAIGIDGPGWLTDPRSRSSRSRSSTSGRAWGSPR